MKEGVDETINKRSCYSTKLLRTCMFMRSRLPGRTSASAVMKVAGKQAVAWL